MMSRGNRSWCGSSQFRIACGSVSWRSGDVTDTVVRSSWPDVGKVSWPVISMTGLFFAIPRVSLTGPGLNETNGTGNAVTSPSETRSTTIEVTSVAVRRVTNPALRSWWSRSHGLRRPADDYDDPDPGDVPEWLADRG